mgnify:CR=1 FL=1
MGSPLPGGESALQWLSQHGAVWRPGQRVRRLAPQTGGWQVDDEHFDAVPGLKRESW